MATFDGSAFSETTMPLLLEMARLPDVEFRFVSIVDEPQGRRVHAPSEAPTAAVLGSRAVVIQRPGATAAETKAQAVQRAMDDAREYLGRLAAQLPEGTRVRCEAHVADDAGGAIVRTALQEQPDVIVMATHGRTGVVRTIFGATAEEVVRSGVAPVLLAHPEHGRRAFQERQVL